ncbi:MULTISPECIES: serine hydrolase [unclassified Frondihabitans]|uniref:serine hydrolase domain-containing protein n=1 Tax=unclassified Frondihabitans TaxID=2626248 RepID=UPI000F50EC65|nr:MULTISPECIES: serine hydrolase [unclassified Frondihabitans]RPE75142.1 CubicO group peptidase (beta-lactamase class C family) [Frondihabitans sp. PhB153]RPF04384.1 CubicO group peptidase (beta-lactamase class C family) [Frondihabitans sp. PhB161]
MITDALPRTRPSAVGIDAAGIAALVDALESTAGVEPHSLMVLRHGQVAAEGWWAPYSAERQHLLYSISKSFTSTAVGFAIAEGLFSLDDTVISHFPELDAEITDEKSRRIRVRHLLAMASGHREETVARAYSIDPVDLVRGFLLMPPDEEPGTLFCYNQPCTFTLGAIVQRLSGQSLTDYLRPRLFDPLGIGEVGWQTDASGRQLGFSGFYAPTVALAKLAQLYLQRGMWEGEQILPASWVDDATVSHIDNSNHGDKDWGQGYGFQFWMARHGYRGDGAYGQFAVVLPEHDVVIAITGQTPDMQAVLDAVWKNLLPAIDGSMPSAEADDALAERLAGVELPVASAPSTRVSGTFTPGAGNRLATLTSVAYLPGGLGLEGGHALPSDTGEGSDTVELVDRGETLRATVGVGSWALSEAVAVAASDGPNGTVRLDVIFVETPHRLIVTLDPVSSTFAAEWQTEPLDEAPLVRRRMPRA